MSVILIAKILKILTPHLQLPMKITEEARKFIGRHLKDFTTPVVMIYDAKVMGWWGMERKTHIGLQEIPFENLAVLFHMNIPFILYPMPEIACPVYMEDESVPFLTHATIDLIRLGMYKYLSIA